MAQRFDKPDEQKSFMTEELLQDCYRFEHEKIIENVYSYGLLATRTLLLLNGGAAIALLAFFGQLVGGEQAMGSRQIVPALAMKAAPALWCFLGGAAMAGFVAATGYLSQSGYASSMWKDQGRSYDPRFERWAEPLQKIAIVMFLVGMVLFLLGGIIAGRAMGL